MKYFVCIFLLSVFCASCTTKKTQTKGLPEVEVITVDFGKEYTDRKFPNTNYSMLIQKLEDNKEYPIGQVDKLVVDKNNLYLLDRHKAQSLFIYSRDGKFLKAITQRGRGPGEFLCPDDFVVNKITGNIIIMDISQKKLLFYSLDGKYIKELKYNFFITNFILDNDNNFLMDNAGIPVAEGESKYLKRMDMNGKLLSEFFPYNPSTAGIPFNPRATLQKYDNNEIFYLPPVSNIVYRLDGDNYTPAYQIDFGNDWPPKEFCEKLLPMHPVQMRDAMTENHYIRFLNFIRTKDVLHFDFNKEKDKRHSLYYNMVTKKSLLISTDEDSFSYPIATYGDEFIFVDYKETGQVAVIFYTVNFNID